jgi:putative hydrolase
VSSGPPDQNPFGDGDPFKGMPLFGDLARLFQQQGPVAWEAAKQLALSIATNGEPEPNVDPVERMAIEQLARVAELQVANTTGLTVSPTGSGITILPVTRSQWALQTLEAYRPLFEELAASLDDDRPDVVDGLPDDLGDADPMAWMAPLMEMLGPMMLGMTAGSMVGHLARRAFGQYDLPIPRPPSDQLLIVPATLDEFGQAWSLPSDDLRLWVCLSEVAHHAVLNVPHVRDRISSLLHGYLSGFEGGGGGLDDRLGSLELSDASQLADLQSMFGDPEVLLGAIQSPRQRELLPQLEALVTTVAGYVDHVMDQVGSGLIASYPMLTEALRRHRVETDPSDRFVERLFGLELTQSQYDRGERFVQGVVERAGTSGLARLWDDEAHLPTPAEVDAPGLWLARIDLPLA